MRASRGGTARVEGCKGVGGGEGVCLMDSETWRGVALAEESPMSLGSLVGFSDTVFALAGSIVG